MRSVVFSVVEILEALHAIKVVGSEGEEYNRAFDVIDALVAFGLVKSTDYAECKFDVADGEICDAALCVIRVHRSVLCEDRWAQRPAAEHPKPLQEVVGFPVKPQSPQGREDGVGAPSAARALQGGDRCDCGQSSPCYSSECYHPWRRWPVRDRLDISQHK